MTYSDFLSTVVFLVRQQLPEGSEPEIHTVLKNNDTKLNALTIRRDGSQIAPTIYLESYYDAYCCGRDISDIVDEILSVYEKSLPEDVPDLAFFTDYSKVKEKLALKLINYDRNRELLCDVPYQPFLDLAVVCYCLLSESDTGNATVLIRNAHLTTWGIEKETLFQDAAQNAKQMLSSEIMDMNSILKDVFGSEDLTPSGRLFVLSNRLRLNGASCILYDDVLRNFSDETDSGFYVLPSSIHEVILMPEKERTGTEDALTRMITEINRSEVPETDILSDHAYYYDRSVHQIYSL